MSEQGSRCTLDAFYQMKHTGTVGFDILKTDIPEFSWERTSVLKGYHWEVGLLASDSCRDPSLLALFFQYMEQSCSNHWAQYDQFYCASNTGFNSAQSKLWIYEVTGEDNNKSQKQEIGYRFRHYRPGYYYIEPVDCNGCYGADIARQQSLCYEVIW